jgi:hypothetical protein
MQQHVRRQVGVAGGVVQVEHGVRQQVVVAAIMPGRHLCMSVHIAAPAHNGKNRGRPQGV